jgi:hypothetical protein
MIRRLLERILAAWSRPTEAPSQAPPSSALESFGVDLSDLNLGDPVDLFAALRRVVGQARLEAWRASRVPPHQRRPGADLRDPLRVYGSVAPLPPEVTPLPRRDRAVG